MWQRRSITAHRPPWPLCNSILQGKDQQYQRCVPNITLKIYGMQIYREVALDGLLGTLAVFQLHFSLTLLSRGSPLLLSLRLDTIWNQA